MIEQSVKKDRIVLGWTVSVIGFEESDLPSSGDDRNHCEVQVFRRIFFSFGHQLNKSCQVSQCNDTLFLTDLFFGLGRRTTTRDLREWIRWMHFIIWFWKSRLAIGIRSKTEITTTLPKCHDIIRSVSFLFFLFRNFSSRKNVAREPFPYNRNLFSASVF